jgi:lipopolysaccharide transport system permease protein
MPAGSGPPPFALPDKPLVTIEPDNTWVALDFEELWAYRELLYFLSWREVKVRYKQTIIGLAWVVMQPLIMTIVFTLVLGALARVPSDGIPYPLFSYLGVAPWTFFSGAALSSGQSLVGNVHLITKVYFPRFVIPAAAVGSKLLDFGVAFIILAGLLVYYHVPPSATLLLLPILIAIISLFALGIGMWTSSLNVKYRDVGVALPVLLQVWMYASPVLYPSSLVPAQWRTLYGLNPMVGLIEGFRAAVLGRPFPGRAVAVSALSAVVLFICASYAFRRMETSFADVI